MEMEGEGPKRTKMRARKEEKAEKGRRTEGRTDRRK